MAFVTETFPNKVFESFEEYKLYLKIREKIRKKLKDKANSQIKVVKVDRIEKKVEHSKNTEEIVKCLLRLIES